MRTIKKFTWLLYQDNATVAHFLLVNVYPREPNIQEHRVHSSIVDLQQHTIFL